MKKQKFDSYTLRADGKWHSLLKTSLEGLTAFEIIGYAQGIKGSGKYCVIHSIVLNAYNGKGGRILSNCDYCGWRWWQRLKLRWVGTPFDYKLQIKTCSNYGSDSRIIVSVKSLLKNEFEHVGQT